MSGRKIIAGLDVGTTKIFTIVAEVVGDSFEIIAIGKSPSNGLRKGIVVDMDLTVDSIKASINDASTQAGFTIEEVYVGIAGGHIKSFKSSGVVGITDGVVGQKDIDRVMDSAQAVYVPLDREVLHIVPIEYIVDGDGGILNPIGMKGVRLEASIQIITGSVTSIQNLLKCCELSNVHVVEIVLEPFASAMAALEEDEKKEGAIVVDIGGGTSDIILYKNQTFFDVSILSVGGNHFTNDIAVGLRLPYLEAERIKKAYGSAMSQQDDDMNELSIMVANRVVKVIPRKILTDIIAPRTQEVCELVRREIEKMGGYELAPYGVVLTGGASLLNGIDIMCEGILKLPVRIGGPVGSGVTDAVKSPIYTTAFGLLRYAMKDNKGEGNAAVVKTWDFYGITGNIRGWFKGIFSKEKNQVKNNK
ncbi:MAG: cell division protein FtsA [Nitrospirae bacterium]|nr:cell division protein FtsA [Nitrospirota bacterium]